MKDILQHINSVDGVIGAALFSHTGKVVAHAFPALIDVESLKKAASLTLECSHGLQISQTADLFDLRYSDGRVIIKVFPGAILFLLCANSINLQVLSITLNLAIKKIEPKLLSEVTAEPTPPATASGDGLLRMKIGNLANKQASASFDSLGMVAISQSTAQQITDFYKSPFKKLTLTNNVAGISGVFPVMIVKDMDQSYDGSIVVGPGIEKKLKVSEGDSLEIKISGL